MKKKIALLLGLTLGFTAISCCFPLSRTAAAETSSNETSVGTTGVAEEGSVTMYRLYNPNSGEHFYTGNETEKTDLVKAGWSDEGIGWIAPVKSDSPVYRLYNANAGDHHYTLNVNEKDNLVRLGWNYEGIGWYSDDKKSVPLYREYNPNAVTGTHNYTTDKAEHDNLVKLGWRDEEIGWYGIEDKDDPVDDPTESDDDSPKIGDIVMLGKYEQDNDFTNGPEPIEWQVLDIKDGHKLLLSKYALDCQPYHDKYEPTTWKDCFLRKWLNSDFYMTAFSDEEKAMITMSHNKNEGSNYTDDKVFLLSVDDVYNYFDNVTIDDYTAYTGNYDSYIKAIKENFNASTLCEPTEYAKAFKSETFEERRAVYVFENNDVPECSGGCNWWLRTCASEKDFKLEIAETASDEAALIYQLGTLSTRENNMEAYSVEYDDWTMRLPENVGVRPVIILK